MALFQPTTPGVYWETVFSPPTLDLLTGVPAFLGFADPVNKQDAIAQPNQPQMLMLWSQFEEIFGQPKDSYLPYAVQGFFGNGGRVCYVVRLRDRTETEIERSLAEALQALTVVEAIDLVCAPDLVRYQDGAQVLRMQAALLEHCEQMGDRFAILDAANGFNIDSVQKQQQDLSKQPASHNSALYFPWIKVPRLKIEPGSETLYVPPSGHVAGTYARSDTDVGVHKTPANYVLEGVVDLNVDLSNADQLRLNPDDQAAGVNCLRILPGRGIRVWGARTLSRELTWRYVNVRRLFLTVGRWVERNLANFAFEPNDLMLWIRIERELTAYLESLLAQGALQGSSPQEAFYIKCDAETNPAEVRDRGMVVTEIGLAPTIPNEFIVVRLIQGETGVTLA